MKQKKLSLQIQFINKIKSSHWRTTNILLVNELSDLLEISPDSAYRRIRGETSFTLDEIVKICEHYKISFDSFSGSDVGAVTFYYESLKNHEESFKVYLKSIFQGLEILQKYENRHIFYAAEDIPIFHLFKFPELSSFKIFYWMKSVLNVPSLRDKKFDVSLIDKEILDIGKKIFEIYNTIPSTEIWTELTINSLLKQIGYYSESGLFENKETLFIICKQLVVMLKSIQKQAELSTKFVSEKKIYENPNNFSLYASEVEIGNNCILTTIGESKTVYLTCNTFNKMLTTNVNFCNETETWFKNLIKQSVLISGVGEKQRYRFFQKEIEKVNELIERLKI